MRVEGSVRKLSEGELHEQLRGTCFSGEVHHPTRDRVLGIAGGIPPLVDRHRPREANARVEKTCVNDQGEAFASPSGSLPRRLLAKLCHEEVQHRRRGRSRARQVPIRALKIRVLEGFNDLVSVAHLAVAHEPRA